MDAANCIYQIKQRLLNGTWVNPRGDSNGLYKTTKVSKNAGVMNVLRLPYGKVNMPVTGRLYMVVELGFVPSQLLAMQQSPDWWIPIKDLYLNQFIQVQGVSQGRLLSLENSYIRYERNHNILIAIDYEYNKYTLGLHDDIYYRFYKCAAYDVVMQDQGGNNLTYGDFTGWPSYQLTNTLPAPQYACYKKVSNSEQEELAYLELVGIINRSANKGQLLYEGVSYLNGLLYLSKTWDLLNFVYPPFAELKIGDVVDLYRDFTAENYVSVVSIVDLPTYWSDADQKNKVIFSIPEDELTYYNSDPYANIFLDDYEIYIVHAVQLMDGGNFTYGKLLPRYHVSTYRHLTLRGIGISSDEITNSLNELRAFVDIKYSGSSEITSDTSYLLVIKHNNGQVRTIINDSNNVKDLSSLAIYFSDRHNEALTGVNSNFTLWKASTLEVSPYNLWIDLPTKEIFTASIYGVVHRDKAKNLLQGVYVKYQNGETRDYVTNDLLPTKYSLPPIATPNGCMVLGFRNYTTYAGPNATVHQEYTVVNHLPGDYSNFEYLSDRHSQLVFPYQPTLEPLDIVVLANVTGTTVLDTTLGVFCYYLKNGQLTVAVSDVDYYLVETATTTTVHWSVDMEAYERYIRIADRYIMREVTLDVSHFVDGIDIYGSRAHTNAVGMDSLIVVVDGFYMVEGVDYVVKDLKIYPNSALFNVADVCLIIYSGLPNPSLLHEVKNVEVEFSSNNWFGYFRSNTTYTLALDRNLMVSLGGTLLDAEALSNFYAEDFTEGVGINTSISSNDLNGAPRCLFKKPNFIKRETLDSFCLTENQTKAIDQQTSEYLNTLNPQGFPDIIPYIQHTYQLFSPLMHALIMDIAVNSTLVITESSYTDAQIEQMVALYLHYLAVDPCMRDLDSTFVRIDPAWSVTSMPMSYGVNAREFAFLSHVNHYILNDKVGNFNLFLYVTGP